MEPDLVGDPRIEITGPVSGMMVCLKEVRELTGHPWWLFLFETALVARLIVFPFVKASQLTMSNMMQGQRAAVEDLIMNGVKPTGALVMTKTIRTFVANGGSLFPMLRPILIAAPLFMTIVMAIRSMARSAYPSFQEGGLEPYLNLAVVDESGLLPLASVGLALMFLQYTYGQTPLLAFRVIKWGLQGLLLFSLPVSYLLPAGAHFYWIDATLLGFTQVALLRNARFRKLMGLPELLKKV